MMALFTPPGREAKKQQVPTTQLHPYFKKPGKSHNHDSCDACGEGGDIICCDTCPASFHFACHSPPLEEEDLPMGEWTCLRCYVREQARLKAIVSGAPWPLPENVSAVDLLKAANDDVKKTGGSNGNGANGNSSKATKRQLEAVAKAEKDKKIQIYKLKYDKYLTIKPETNSPFDSLIAAAQVMNAEQFKLPNEMDPKEELPFSWKWADDKADQDDHGPKFCYVCRKANRGMPAIACDYCSSIFHLDCLDPPLSEIPRQERWMCPLHVE